MFVPEFEHTFGPQVGRLCEQAGLKPDPEQQLILDAIFAVGGDARAAAFEIAVIATRQQLKTGVLKMAALGWLFVTQEELTTWSAHLFSTTQEAFRDLAGLIGATAMLRKRMAPGPSDGIHGARGSEHFETRDGRRLAFKSRTKSGGRGLTGDKVILDEALFLEDEHMGSLVPTLTAVDDPQLLYASSAGLARSHILRDIRDRGRIGGSDLAYFEWCAERRDCATPTCRHVKPSHPDWVEGCALDDEDLWRSTTPLLGRRRANGTGLSLAKMRKFRMAEPPEEWMRERMGWWDEPGADHAFGVGAWDRAAVEYPTPMDFRPTAIGLSVSVDLASSGVVACGLREAEAGAVPAVKVLASGPGQSWAVDQAIRAAKDLGARVFLVQGGPAAPLERPLREALRSRVQTLSYAQYLDACAGLFVAVTTGEFQHGNQAELNESVAGAEKVDKGDRWAWSRRGSVDITLLEAATVAVWGATRGARRSAADERIESGGSAVPTI